MDYLWKENPQWIICETVPLILNNTIYAMALLRLQKHKYKIPVAPKVTTVHANIIKDHLNHLGNATSNTISVFILLFLFLILIAK